MPPLHLDGPHAGSTGGKQLAGRFVLVGAPQVRQRRVQAVAALERRKIEAEWKPLRRPWWRWWGQP